MDTTGKYCAQYVCKAAVGAVFCISGILKMLSMEAFEIYIYGFQFFGFNFSCLLARFIICVELILGLCLILNLLKTCSYAGSLLLLVSLSFFLTYVYFARGNHDNCHCFGDLVKMNPLPSILKNILFIILLLVSRNATPFRVKYEKVSTAFLSVVLLAAVFTLSPPDFMIRKSDAGLNEAALQEAFADKKLDPAILNSGNRILCFYGLGCQYCELTARKLAIIRKRHPDAKLNFIGIFWGEQDTRRQFIEETELHYLETFFIDPVTFLTITNGKMPLVLVMKDGKITERLNYTGIREDVFLDMTGR